MSGNRTTLYQEIGPEPALDNYGDLQRWDKWNAWSRRRNNLCCWSNRFERACGRIDYYKTLESQAFRRGHPRHFRPLRGMARGPMRSEVTKRFRLSQ